MKGEAGFPAMRGLPGLRAAETELPGLPGIYALKGDAPKPPEVSCPPAPVRRIFPETWFWSDLLLNDEKYVMLRAVSRTKSLHFVGQEKLLFGLKSVKCCFHRFAVNSFHLFISTFFHVCFCYSHTIHYPTFHACCFQLWPCP